MCLLYNKLLHVYKNLKHLIVLRMPAFADDLVHACCLCERERVLAASKPCLYLFLVIELVELWKGQIFMLQEVQQGAQSEYVGSRRVLVFTGMRVARLCVLTGAALKQDSLAIAGI